MRSNCPKASAERQVDKPTYRNGKYQLEIDGHGPQGYDHGPGLVTTMVQGSSRPWSQALSYMAKDNLGQQRLLVPWMHLRDYIQAQWGLGLDLGLGLGLVVHCCIWF